MGTLLPLSGKLRTCFAPFPGRRGASRSRNLKLVRDGIAGASGEAPRLGIGFMRHHGTGELARRRLQGSPYLALRDLGCAYHDGVLTLWGSLPSHYLKHVAQTMVGDVAGVTTLVNTIAVVPPVRRARAVHEQELRRKAGLRGDRWGGSVFGADFHRLAQPRRFPHGADPCQPSRKARIVVS
jgi:hypothetical protein